MFAFQSLIVVMNVGIVDYPESPRKITVYKQLCFWLESFTVKYKHELWISINTTAWYMAAVIYVSRASCCLHRNRSRSRPRIPLGDSPWPGMLLRPWFALKTRFFPPCQLNHEEKRKTAPKVLKRQKVSENRDLTVFALWPTLLTWGFLLSSECFIVLSLSVCPVPFP